MTATPEMLDAGVSILADHRLGGSLYATTEAMYDAMRALEPEASLAAELAKAKEALGKIAEGNLGDASWQANYDKIREVARAALQATPEPKP